MTDDEFDAYLDQALDELEAKQRTLSAEFGLGHNGRFVMDYEAGIRRCLQECERNIYRIYACLSLVTTKADYNANRVFCKKMLSTLEIHP